MLLTAVKANIDLTPLIAAVIGLVSTAISCVLIPYIRAKYGEHKVKQLEYWVDIAVRMAQQVYYACDGPTRKQKALEFLASKGYDVNDASVLATLEASVLSVHTELEYKRNDKIVIQETKSES